MSKYPNLLIRASAGTGKTFQLSNRFIRLLNSGALADEILASTFTRKAAAEIRARFQIRLQQAIQSSEGIHRSRLQDALQHIERCFVGTIHAFCARILRERPIEAGIDVGFEEIDEEADRRLRDDIPQ